MKRLFVLLVAMLVLSLASTSTTFAQIVAHQEYCSIGTDQHAPDVNFNIVGIQMYTLRGATVGRAYVNASMSDGFITCQVSTSLADRVVCNRVQYSQARSPQARLISSAAIYLPEGGAVTVDVCATGSGTDVICDAPTLFRKIGITNPDVPWDQKDPIQSVEMPKKIIALLRQQ